MARLRTPIAGHCGNKIRASVKLALGRHSTLRLGPEETLENASFCRPSSLDDRLRRRQLQNSKERRVGIGGNVVAVEVVDPDLLVATELGDASGVAGLVASVIGRRGVGADGVHARPALQERLVVDHHRETAACCRVVVQQLTRKQCPCVQFA